MDNAERQPMLSNERGPSTPEAMAGKQAAYVLTAYDYSYSDSSSDRDDDCRSAGSDDEEYCNIAQILQAKHEQYDEDEGGLCKHCWMAPWSDAHKQECQFIPQWIKDGESRPYGAVSRLNCFSGHFSDFPKL